MVTSRRKKPAELIGHLRDTLRQTGASIVVEQLSMALTTMDPPRAPKGQLLKWIGNKQRYAGQIVGLFPTDFGTYYEPFLGSGAVLATLAPPLGVGSDVFAPLVEIWQALKHSPDVVKSWYVERWNLIAKLGKQEAYRDVRARYNASPSGADLLFLSRACYGGVVRFRKMDGYMSTPCGAHEPIAPDVFGKRVDDWHRRVRGTEFVCADYREVLSHARAGDLVYCDPPYLHSQSILYGAQEFRLPDLFVEIDHLKSRGVRVVLSIDGRKSSGDRQCPLDIPDGLFANTVWIDCGPSMLKRFQLLGETGDDHRVADRLLLTY
jgi:DNA adenine methylase